MARRYSEEFRYEAVRLVLGSESGIPRIARDLGVSVWTLRDWVRKQRERAGVSSPRRAETLEEENLRLRREVGILRQERDILKKAAAYFAKEQL